MSGNVATLAAAATTAAATGGLSARSARRHLRKDDDDEEFARARGAARARPTCGGYVARCRRARK